jgi:hypothetical protein
LVLCLSSLAVAGCRSGPDATADITDQAAMHSVIVQHAPPGTSVEETLAFMKGEGFQCAMVINGIRVESGDRPQPLLMPRDYVGLETMPAETRAVLFATCRVREGVTFLRCERADQPADASIVGSESGPIWGWTIDFVVEDDKVVEVVCQSGWSGRRF